MLLIASLGGSSEPLVVSLRTHRPERVWFVASESSREQVAEVIQRSGFEGPAEVVCVPIPTISRARSPPWSERSRSAVSAWSSPGGTAQS